MRESENEGATRFDEALDRSIPFGITGADFERLAEYFGTQRFYEPRDPLESYRWPRGCTSAAAASGLSCVRRIARVAIEHDLLLLHSDRDYENMSRVIPELKTA